jgi:hypothetical protein
MRTFIHVCLLVLIISAGSQAKTIKLGSDLLTVEIDECSQRISPHIYGWPAYKRIWG